MATSYDSIIITAPISLAKVEDFKAKFTNVFYHPSGQDDKIPEEELNLVDIWYSRWTGLGPHVTQLEQIPRLKIVQLSAAGANTFLATPLMKCEGAIEAIKVCSASGIHSISIPQYVVCNVVNLYMKHHLQFHLARAKNEWPAHEKVMGIAGSSAVSHPENRTLTGKTVGLLGYGHIARETARLFKAFNCHIIAANSRGDKRSEEGYRIPGTGDADGSLPEQYYSTNDPESFTQFLSRCDILVASLPSTPQTIYMLTEKHLSSLPEGAVFVNVGRGDLVRSEDILRALDAPGGLSGVVLDVTDPEPLPDGHPLLTHPASIVTAHTSGSFEGYYDAGGDVLLASVDRLRKGEEALNVVDSARGY